MSKCKHDWVDNNLFTECSKCDDVLTIEHYRTLEADNAEVKSSYG